MFNTIAILTVGCFVVYAVVAAVASFTDGGRARRVMVPSPAMPHNRTRR
jgi:hypothetical protein